MRRLAAVALLAALSACATPEPPRHHSGPGGRGGPPGGPEGGPPRARPFISPAGEPFRPSGGGLEPIRSWFDQADANHDGVLGKDEFVADHMRFFRLLDVNGDGRIDNEETIRYEREVAPEILSAVDRGERGRMGGCGRGMGGGGRGRPPGGGGRRGGGGGPPGGGGFVSPGGGLSGAAAYSLINEPEPVRAADTDLDSFITVKEWQAAAAIRFSDLDLNKDGRIAFDELHLRGPGSGGRGPGKR